MFLSADPASSFGGYQMNGPIMDKFRPINPPKKNFFGHLSNLPCLDALLFGCLLSCFIKTFTQLSFVRCYND
jgi:hypothetical protein